MIVVLVYFQRYTVSYFPIIFSKSSKLLLGLGGGSKGFILFQNSEYLVIASDFSFCHYKVLHCVVILHFSDRFKIRIIPIILSSCNLRI